MELYVVAAELAFLLVDAVLVTPPAFSSDRR
jgi:hypothetical protein